MLDEAAQRRSETAHLPRCDVDTCERVAYRAGRCVEHFAPMRTLVDGMSGYRTGTTISKKLFSQAMSETTMSVDEWSDLDSYDRDADAQLIEGLLDRAAEALIITG